MNKLRFAVIGAGFWSNFQIPGWLESDEVELVALCDRTLDRAIQVGKKFDVENVYDDAATLLENEKLDFIDIITDVDTHLKFTRMAAEKGVDVVCQKPMSISWEDAKELLNVTKRQNVKLFVNENFRWQVPIRKVKEIMDSGIIGEVFKGRATFCSAFPVFDNQPFLKELDRFIMTDVGSHIFDVCRFLFGEAKTLCCHTKRVNPEIRGEDVANALMEMENGIHCFAEMSYASKLEREVFPQTLLLIEGTEGSIQLAADYEVKVTTKKGTISEVIKPVMYDWINPKYAVIHSSIVDTQKNIIEGLKGGNAETIGEDNMETVRLVWAAYHSAENKEIVELNNFK